ncbi:MAG: hypothetical protein WDM78_19195 [Puia sp.]
MRSANPWHLEHYDHYDKSIHLDYVLEMNPGGSLPVWILNLFSTKGPMESFEKHKEKNE